MITIVGGYGQGLTMRVARAPRAGETISGGEFSADHGGKGSNQAVAVRRLGVASRIVTALGDDAGAHAARELWRAEGVEDRSVVIDGSTTMAGFIIVDPSGENRICIADGALSALEPHHVDAAIGEFGPADTVLVSLEVAPHAAARALELGRAGGARTILNPAPVGEDTRAMLRDADVVTPNRGELAVLAGTTEPTTIDGVRDTCRLLRETTGFAGVLVVTLGADGVLVDDGVASEHLAPILVPHVVDTTGAGDTFSAALAVALHDGLSLRDSARFAAAAGAISVTQEQVIPSLPYRADVDQLISQGGKFS